MAIDITEDLVPVDQAKLSEISTAAQELLRLKAQIEEYQGYINQVAARVRVLEEKTLVDLLLAAGMAEFTLINGTVIQLDEDMKLSVPKKNMEDICTWLTRNRHGDIIKYEVVVPVPKGDGAKAQVAILEKFLASKKFSYTKEKNVHSGTLKALLRDLRNKGLELDLELFGAFEYKKVKVLPPSEGKAEK